MVLKMHFTIVRKFYNSIRDMNPDNPCEVTDIWTNKGCDPLTQEQAQIVLPKLISGKLFLNEIQPINKSGV